MELRNVTNEKELTDEQNFDAETFQAFQDNPPSMRDFSSGSSSAGRVSVQVKSWKALSLAGLGRLDQRTGIYKDQCNHQVGEIPTKTRQNDRTTRM